jgi:hypothetical protein
MADPLVPANLDLEGFEFMPVDVRRLLKSDTWILGSAEERTASLALWFESWHQVPAGSLPNNERALAHLSQSASGWKKVREHALRGWVECADGRLYHPVVCAKALEAWLEKLAQRISSGLGNAQRWGIAFDQAAVERDMDIARGMLTVLDPDSRALRKRRTAKRTGNPDANVGESPDGIPTGLQDESRSNPNRQGQGQGQGHDKDSSPDGEVGTPSGAPPCPHTDVIAVYHEVLPEWRRVAEWNETRQGLLRARWRSKPSRQSVGWWRRFFEYVRKSPFLMGQEHDESRRPFEGDLEWLIRPTNFAKVIEGKYHAPEGGDA